MHLPGEELLMQFGLFGYSPLVYEKGQHQKEGETIKPCFSDQTVILFPT